MNWPVVFSFFPIIILIYLMVKKNSMPSYRALPLSALLTYFILLVIFREGPNLVHASVMSGLLVAWTPILIIAGAILLFKTMEYTGAMNTIRIWLNGISSHKVAQLMIVGWAFPFLIEGASGFGTPAALAAPVLVGLGFPPVRVAILTLVNNSIPVSFGAVGTPTWFGFSTIDLSHQQIMDISFKSAVMNSGAALVVPFLAMAFIVKTKDMIKNWLFIIFSILLTVIPYMLVARFNYEFPALMGGFTGLLGTVILARYGIGLSKDEVQTHEKVGESHLTSSTTLVGQGKTVSSSNLVKASFPLWGTLVILILTRIPEVGLKGLLTAAEPALDINLGSLGVFSISPSLVVSLKHIFNTGVGWTHSILYVPSFIPFVLVSLITFLLYRNKITGMKKVTGETINQMKRPTVALLGALVFVNLMMLGDNESAVSLIGQTLADKTGGAWQYVASFLGALGSFFSGSNTISNLTFGGIQYSIANTLNLNLTTILAMQSVGGAMGNMVCINNIVAVASVLALDKVEGFILKRTARIVLIYGVIVGFISIFI